MKKIVYIFLCLPFFSWAQTKEEYIARVKSNPDSISTLIDLRRVGGYDPNYQELQNLYNNLSDVVKQSLEGQEFQTYLNVLSTVLIGKQAPDFAQQDTSASIVSLSEFRGKYVLLDFWASWCPDCRKESPALVATYERFKSDRFEIIGISFDRNRAAWIKGIQDDRRNWIHLSDLKRWQNEVGTLYGVKSIPQNVLIDPAGRIIAKNLHNEDLNNKLAEVLQ